jgi:magnesium-protoporphyrin IX monomethyl ester (oxidative) cyclase
MKFAFINPSHGYTTLRNPPVPIMVLSAYIEKYSPETEIKVIDEIAGDNIFSEVDKFNPDIVGISAMTMFATRAYQIADTLREKGFKVAIGGVHASSLPEEAIQHADIVVRGEGEKAIIDIIKGKIEEGIIERPIIQNLDDIPIPARHLMNMDFYLNQRDQIPGHKIKAERILTSRGCPYRCIFCRNSEKLSPIRFHSPEHVAEEVEQVIRKYKAEGISFLDDNFLMDKKRIEKLFEILEDKKLKFIWDCQTSVTMVRDIDFLKFLKEKGCLQIGFGFESGSPRILQVLNKTATIEENEEAIRNCKEAGIKVRGCFIIGSPTETKENIKMTEDFIDRNKIDFVGVFLMTVYPGTSLWKYCKQNNLLPEKLEWYKFTTGYEVEQFCNTTIPMDELKKIHARLNIKYSITSYKPLHLLRRIIKHPKVTLDWLKGYLAK